VNANVYENLTLQAEQVSYRSVEEYVQSDHKPVVGEFVIKVHRYKYIWREGLLKNAVFWDVTLCGSCKKQRFGGT
jgi:hypothetical protein